MRSLRFRAIAPIGPDTPPFIYHQYLLGVMVMVVAARENNDEEGDEAWILEESL
jgi:hypothetical protein